MQKPNVERVQVYVADKSALFARAEKEDKTVSELVRIALKKTFHI